MLEFTPYSSTSAIVFAPRSFRNSSVNTEMVEAESISRVLKRLAATESPAAYPTSRSDETENGFRTIGSDSRPDTLFPVGAAGVGCATSRPIKKIKEAKTAPHARQSMARG